MTEYKTIRIHPMHEEYAIQLFGTFGWELINAQEFYSESTEIDGVDIKFYGNDFFGGFMKGSTGSDGKIDIRTHKNVTNYVTLRFERDTEMPNYEELYQLGNEYDSLANYREPQKPKVRTWITAIGIAIIIASIIMAIVEHNAAEIWEIIVSIIFPISMIPFTLIGWRNYKKRYADYLQIQRRLSEILSEAGKLSYYY